MPWVDGIEIINGSRLPSQNQTAACLADACRKVGVAGSDSHTRRGIGRTWVGAPAREGPRGVPDGTPRRTRARRRTAGQLLHDGVRHAAVGGWLLCRPLSRWRAPFNWKHTPSCSAACWDSRSCAAAGRGAGPLHFGGAVQPRAVVRPGDVRPHGSPRRLDMNVAIFTDNDFDKVNGVTTTLTAALRHAPEGHPPARLHGRGPAVGRPTTSRCVARRADPVLPRDAHVLSRACRTSVARARATGSMSST